MSRSKAHTLHCGQYNKIHICASAALLGVQAVLIVPLSFRYGPTVDEPGHLAAGLAVVTLGRADLYYVNPPLVKSIAALPAAISKCPVDWSAWNVSGPEGRPEWSVGVHLWRANDDHRMLMGPARLAVLPLVLIGGLSCFLWARDVCGPSAAIVSQALWTFCPNIIGNGALITNDAAAAALGVSAGYAFWRWAKRPKWPRAITSGIVVGLAVLTKLTWLILPPLILPLWLTLRYLLRNHVYRTSAWSEVRQLVVMLSVALLVVHAGYGFDRSLWRLEEPSFVSHALAGEESPAAGGSGGNRFRNGPFGRVLIPVPQLLVRGIDLQKLDFDEGQWSFRAGEWRFGGWHTFYIYAALVKLPLGTLVLIGAACFVRGDGDPRRWLAVIVPGGSVLVLISYETGFTKYFRYCLPVLPFMFVWAGRAARLGSNIWGRLFVGGCLVGTAASSIAVWPHSLSYFNEVAGGPANGWRHLTGANLDWGQDLPQLVEWKKAHPEAHPFYVATYGQLASEYAELAYEPATESRVPGWYAVGVTELYSRESRVKWLRTSEAVGMVGYSIRIYHVHGETREAVR